MSQTLSFIGFVLLGLGGMEMVSYLVHRFLFHGVFWKIHESHHRTKNHRFELNDLFSLFFAAISIILISAGSGDPLGSVSFGIGSGIAMYGILYFVIHDLFVHRRFLPFRSNSRFMGSVRRAHRRHHQSVDKVGQEPYGLFLFPYDKFWDGKNRS